MLFPCDFLMLTFAEKNKNDVTMSNRCIMGTLVLSMQSRSIYRGFYIKLTSCYTIYSFFFDHRRYGMRAMFAETLHICKQCNTVFWSVSYSFQHYFVIHKYLFGSVKNHEYTIISCTYFFCLRVVLINMFYLFFVLIMYKGHA